MNEEKFKAQKINKVETKNNEVFELGECIGKGGQGKVFKTQRRNLLVKLSYLTGDDSEKVVEEKYRRYSSLRYCRELPRYLAKPISEIEPIKVKKKVVYGYVMELMEDMVSLGSLYRKNKEEPTECIKRMGGIRRMYVILRRVAEILEGIHANGYVYGDLNPNNVFVSKNPAHSEVQLIDCDNLTIASDFKERIYFPGYGAPELITGVSRNNSLTDTWSFAVLAFKMLRQTMPFHGDMFDNAETTQLLEMEKKEEYGKLPFIDGGEKNAAPQSALPKDVMEAPDLQILFKKTFGDSRSPGTRPLLHEWIDAFRNWENQFVKCASCGEMYLKYNRDDKCPFCDEKKIEPFAFFRKMVFHPDIDPITKPINFDSRIIVGSEPVRVEIPISEYRMLLMEVSLNSETKRISIKQLTEENATVDWSIGWPTDVSYSGKKVELRREIPKELSVSNGEENFLRFQEYSFGEEGERKKARGVLGFRCWGI